MSSDHLAPIRITDHDIDSASVSPNAVVVIETLRDAGYDAYLVGGCVRDLLLGLKPKDFDVATSATPEDVKAVFPRVRLVGRRFRIAHVRFRREIIEVSTFRRHFDPDDEAQNEHNRRSEEGVILRDNAYGRMDEDAFRRDFTINALYCDPISNELLDYTNGLADIEAQSLKLIGDSKQRFREDPVRILRAIRFAAKLGFELDHETADAISPMSELLTAIPPARLFDEFMKLFLNGHAARTWQLMQLYELPEILFPLYDHGEPLIVAALESTDKRVAVNKPVTPGFLLAAILWEEFRERCADTATMSNPGDERMKAAQIVISEQQLTIAVPRRFSMFVRDVWNLQLRLERRLPRTLFKTLDHPRFRAAYDFLVLRAQIGEVDEELSAWWTSIQELDRDEQAATIRALEPKRKRRRRRSRGATSDDADDLDAQPTDLP
ncbi:MAG: polynucleotide adenylyltransferase PcnB [Gammaproteobacteria bacterium]|nr:polynucleotide adenylyltransferase PcnB [Gammaproteobacteria bacterium]